MVIALPIAMIFIALYEEHVFDTLTQSIKILWDGLSSFRRLKPEEEKRIEEKQFYLRRGVVTNEKICTVYAYIDTGHGIYRASGRGINDSYNYIYSDARGEERLYDFKLQRLHHELNK